MVADAETIETICNLIYLHAANMFSALHASDVRLPGPTACLVPYAAEPPPPKANDCFLNVCACFTLTVTMES